MSFRRPAEPPWRQFGIPPSESGVGRGSCPNSWCAGWSDRRDRRATWAASWCGCSMLKDC